VNYDDYVIVMVGGAFLVGQLTRVYEEDILNPGYQLVRAPVPNGGLNMAVVPLAFYHEWTEIKIPKDAPRIEYGKLSHKEKVILRHAVEKCARMVMEMKVEASGISLPKPEIKGL